jgi:type VI protein secretion system component VasK
MNTYTNTMNPKKKVQPTPRSHLFPNTAMIAVILTLVTAVAVAIFIANRSAAAAEDHRAIPYSNSLEMQYARPWLDARNKAVVKYSNALEMQYAQPWLENKNNPVVSFGNALELQYAQPWLEAENKSAVSYSNALELQYARPWLDKAVVGVAVTGNAQDLNCSSSMEMLYACKFGFGIP